MMMMMKIMTLMMIKVGDVAWAPYSSTVFAAVTIDGKVDRYLIFLENSPFYISSRILQLYFKRNLKFCIKIEQWCWSIKRQHCKFLSFVEINILSKGRNSFIDVSLKSWFIFDIGIGSKSILIWEGPHLRLVHQQIQPSLCAGCCPQEKGHDRSK